MTTSFTPGPWEPGCFVNPDSKCHCSYIFSEGYNGSVAKVSVDNECFIQHGGNDSPKLVEARANARLIAAAPDGYALAVAVANHFEGTDAPLGEQARAFLAKAQP